MEHPFPTTFFAELAMRGVVVNEATLVPNAHQGFMSEVYKAQSSAGPVMLRKAVMVDEHVRNKVWEKFTGLAPILAVHPELKTPHIYYAGLIEDTFYLAQAYHEGVVAGKRILDNGRIEDIWSVPESNVVEEVLRILAHLHTITVEGFGWPTVTNGTVQGPYKNLHMFFESEVPRWIASLMQADTRLGIASLIDIEKIQAHVQRVPVDVPGVLVHGDAANPSNILVRGEGDITLLDWEWCIASDPAWEFCDLGWWKLVTPEGLAPYFTARSMGAEEQRNFIERVQNLQSLWLLWATHMHAEDTDPILYRLLRDLLIEKL